MDYVSQTIADALSGRNLKPRPVPVERQKVRILKSPGPDEIFEPYLLPRTFSRWMAEQMVARAEGRLEIVEI